MEPIWSQSELKSMTLFEPSGTAPLRKVKETAQKLVTSFDLANFYSIPCNSKIQKFEDLLRERARRVSKCFRKMRDGRLGATEIS